ncbi:MAG: ribonuclease J [Bacteriovoracaceae bacterium]|nr:ribonuclease J [Bacteriovoracaceae bacterium]
MKNLKITPLGGIGKIGSNCLLIELEKSSLLIDAGIMFPESDLYGVDYLIPNFSFIQEKNLTDIILTHGHEDHIGAISHLLKKFPDIKVWASFFTERLIQRKLYQAGIKKKINIFREQDQLCFENIQIDPIHVNHSIPETFGLFISDKKQNNCIFYVSDFKCHENITYEKPFNFEKLQKISAPFKKKILMADSTNILNRGKTPSEDDLFAGLTQALSCEGRVFITLFASNIYRIKNILRIAKKFKKPVLSLGRSIEEYILAAKESSLLSFDEKEVLFKKNITGSEKNFIGVLSGCQGEFLGSLRKFVDGEHPFFKLQKDDTIVFSSRTIPGNEVSVNRIYNKISEQAARIITDHDMLIHTSGHACQEDLKILINNFQPTHYIPIHGESYFLKKQQEFIHQHFPHLAVFILYNFDSIILGSDFFLAKNPPLEPLFITENRDILEKEALKERKKIATQGIVFITFYHAKREFIISHYGIPKKITSHEEKLKSFLYAQVKNKHNASQNIEETIRLKTRQFLSPMLGYKPNVAIHIIY